MKLLGQPDLASEPLLPCLDAGGAGLADVLPGRLVKHLVFLWREPRSMHDLTRRPVGLGNVRQMLKPAVADGRFQYHAQRHGLVMERAARWWLLVLRELQAPNAIFLHGACANLRQPLLAEERVEVNSDASVMVVDPALVAVAFGQHLVLGHELVGGVLESALADYLTTLDLADEFKIPVLGELLRPA